MKKSTLLIVVVVIVLVIIGVSIYMRNASQPGSVTTSPMPTVSTSPMPSTSGATKTPGMTSISTGHVMPSANGTKIFTDTANTFSFTFPGQFAISGGDGTPTQDWRQQTFTQTTGLLLAKVTIPNTFEPKTNFSEAQFTVGVSSDPQSLQYCLIEKDGNLAKTSQLSVNGVTYTKFTFSDAAAGNLYDTTSYRTVRNQKCYAVQYIIHSTNLANYSPDQGISQFDKTKVQSILESMVHSFKFAH